MEINLGGRKFTILFPDVVRPLTAQERSALKAAIAERGQVSSPIIVDENDGVLDGRNRLEIAKELGMGFLPVTVIRGMTEDEKRRLAVSLNVDRRHLTVKERKAIAAEKKQKTAERIEKTAELAQQGASQRQIAKETGVSQMQVQRDLKKVGGETLLKRVSPPEQTPDKPNGPTTNDKDRELQGLLQCWDAFVSAFKEASPESKHELYKRINSDRESQQIRSALESNRSVS